MRYLQPLFLAAVFSCWSISSAQEFSPPRVVAHRGLLLDSPENTMANFSACLRLGIGFELDVQRSQDGHLVVIHDSTVDRTTNGRGRVSELKLEELRALDAGSWFSPRFRGQKIPTLDEVFALLARFRGAPVLIAVDFKGKDGKIEEDVVRLAEKHRVLPRLLMIGNAIQSPAVRKRLRAANSAAQVAVVANTAAEFSAALNDRHGNWVYVRYIPSAAEVNRTHRAGKRMFIAGQTVAGHQGDNWRILAKRGIDGILTDYAIELGRLLRSRTRKQKQPRQAP